MAAAQLLVFTPIPNPEVKRTEVTEALAIILLEPKYPEVVTLPEPICNCGGLVPLVETPLNITVIRFTQDGMLVKSMLVPDVEASAVPEVMPSTAPELIVTLDDPLILTAMMYP
jgi:hypothetical protein